MPTPLPDLGQSSTEDHLNVSRRFLEHARIELDSGNRLQASEKVWGTAAHSLKAIAIQRGWRHRSHAAENAIGRHLAKEFNDDDLLRHLTNANLTHINFYENDVAASQIRVAINDVERYIAKLDGVRSEPPRPFQIAIGEDRTDLTLILGYRPEVTAYSDVGFSQTHRT